VKDRGKLRAKEVRRTEQRSKKSSMIYDNKWKNTNFLLCCGFV
jgi:hypothetical protein